jgi:hypothetical protein|tara:strand:- start:2207 stop:2521 length:315 start_codon:yes stop_codon:yes gene_type:complete
MDINELKKQSDKSYSLALAKQNALEKAKSRMIMAYNGHLFLANPETINLVQTLAQHHGEFVILDTNNNPCMVTDPAALLEKLIAKNQEVLNTYHQAHKEFQKLR